MRSLTSLFEMDRHVWFCCSSEDLQVQFLKQAESEGFICLNGQKPTSLFSSEFYGISQNMTLGYVSRTVWFMSLRHPGHALEVSTGEHIDPLRIDYGRYINGEEDYLYRRGDS